MSTNEDDLDEQEDQEEEQENVVTLSRKQIRALERKAREAETTSAQLAQLQRELAFAKAGLPLDRKGISYFLKAYDGEMEPEKIREAAIEAGFLEPLQQDVSDQERGTLERMEQASAGGQPPKPEDLTAQINAAKTPEEVMAILQRSRIPTSWDRE